MNRTIPQGQYVSPKAAAESFIGDEYEIDQFGSTISAHPGDYWDVKRDRVLGDLWRKNHAWITTTGRVIIAPRCVKQFAKLSDLQRLARAAESLVVPARDDRYYVVEIGGRVQPGIPTPGLIEAGVAEAYYVGTERSGIWYLHDEKHGYVAKDGRYSRVRVIRNPNDRMTYRG